MAFNTIRLGYTTLFSTEHSLYLYSRTTGSGFFPSDQNFRPTTEALSFLPPFFLTIIPIVFRFNLSDLVAGSHAVGRRVSSMLTISVSSLESSVPRPWKWPVSLLPGGLSVARRVLEGKSHRRRMSRLSKGKLAHALGWHPFL